MGRPRKNAIEQADIKSDVIDNILSNLPKDQFSELPLNSLSDYEAYNKLARETNKKLRMCRHPVKQCPIELHPKQRIKFSRNDQPNNPLPVYLSNELIHFSETLIPGKEYDLPLCVVEHLASKGVPKWKWYDNPDGSRETRISHSDPRFSLRSVYK